MRLLPLLVLAAALTGTASAAKKNNAAAATVASAAAPSSTPIAPKPPPSRPAPSPRPSPSDPSPPPPPSPTPSQPAPSPSAPAPSPPPGPPPPGPPPPSPPPPSAVVPPPSLSAPLSAPLSASAPAPSGSAVPVGGVRTGTYPDADLVPRTDDPQVLEWLKLVNFSSVPSFPLSSDGNCPTGGAALNPNQCWWTCQKCTRPTDIVQCPTTGQWGLSYDDGPTIYTPQLLNWLSTNNVQSTFFVVGSRCSQHTDLIRQELAAGHHLAVHTWSHHALTSLTNEQIVAEVKWTEKCIKDAGGVTPVYMRPPYGDVDDRVRSILLQLGYKIVIWTDGFDTNDWQLSTGGITPDAVTTNFQGWLTKLPTLSNGIIVLEHDLYPQSVDVAVNRLLPMAKQANVQMMPIPQCLGDPKPYLEGATATNMPNVSILSNGTGVFPTGLSPGVNVISAGSVSDVGSSSVVLIISAMIYAFFM